MLGYVRYLVIFLFLAAVGAAIYFGNPQSTLFGRQADLKGIWIDQTGKVAVELYPCSKAICGRVVWVYGDPNQKGADGQRVCGTQVLGGLQRTSGVTWDGGWIYNPMDRGRYSAYVESVSGNVISVTGYMGSRWFGQTFEWRKAPSNLKLCA